VTVIIEKLVQLCAHLHSIGVTAANLHPNNIFIDEDNPSDVLVTDIGFLYMPQMDPVNRMQTEFSAPEVVGKFGMELEKAVHDAPFTCDLFAISAMAKFMLTGSTDNTAEDLEGSVSPEM